MTRPWSLLFSFDVGFSDVVLIDKQMMMMMMMMIHNDEAIRQLHSRVCSYTAVSNLPVDYMEEPSARCGVDDATLVCGETVFHDWVSELYAQQRVLSPVSTTRVDGPSWRVTGFHYPSTRAVLTGARFH